MKDNEIEQDKVVIHFTAVAANAYDDMDRSGNLIKHWELYPHGDLIVYSVCKRINCVL